MSEEIVEKGYDKIAEKYHSVRDRFSHEKELNEFMKFIPKNGRILDVGSGSGVPIAKKLIEHGFEVVGIDISQKMIELAKKNVPQATFIKMEMTNLEFDDASFDGLVAFYSIIHLSREKHSLLFRNFNRILKKTGVMFVCLGPAEYEGTEEYLGEKMFWSHYEPKKALQIIKDAGFTIIFDRKITSGEETHYWVLARKESTEKE